LFAETIETLSGWIAEPPRLLQLDMLARIVLQLILFAASAFFSGSETALFSLTKFDLQRVSRSRDASAETLHSLLEQPRRLIVSILCGNELVNIAAATNMTGILVELVGIEAAAFTAAFVMIPLILVFGEVTPKTLAVTRPTWVSTRIVARPMAVWVRLVAPLALVVRAIADRTTTLIVGPERAKQNILHIEELRNLIDEGVESGELSPTERSLVEGLIRAGSTEVREIMTPRTQVVFLDGALEGEEQREECLRLQRARVPVFQGNRDTVIGFLYAEDLLAHDTPSGSDAASAPVLHPPLAVSPTTQIDEMLEFFDRHDARAALVVNEFGATDGIVTLSDVTRYLFAGVFDTAAAGGEEVEQIDGAYHVMGTTSLPEVCRITGLDLTDPTMTTIAGAVLRRFGRVPSVGECCELDGFEVEVLEMDNLRIACVRLRHITAAERDERETVL
jgi:CBS domain containing-hemolysin-like protein